MTGARKPTPPTLKKMSDFIEALSELGSVRHAAEAAGMNRTHAYELRATVESFAARWRDALADSADVLEQEARRRAMAGHAEPVIYQGKLCYRLGADGKPEMGEDGRPIPLTVRKFSDTLLMCLLNANNPDKFHYRAKFEQRNTQDKPEDTPIGDLTDAQLDDLIARAGDALDDLERRKAGGAGKGEAKSGPQSPAGVH